MQIKAVEILPEEMEFLAVLKLIDHCKVCRGHSIQATRKKLVHVTAIAILHGAREYLE